MSVRLTQVAVTLAIAAMGLNVLVGYTGLTSFGHGAWFGLAAYAAGLAQLHLFPGQMILPLLAGFLLVADIGYALLDQPIIDGTDVLPVMVLASILFDALLAYAVDCAAIGVLAEADEPPPRAP